MSFLLSYVIDHYFLSINNGEPEREWEQVATDRVYGEVTCQTVCDHWRIFCLNLWKGLNLIKLLLRNSLKYIASCELGHIYKISHHVG